MIRALALITIFVNHVPGNPFEALTSKNFGFSDAAEAFVLISGVSAGLAYGLKFRPGARLATTLKMWRRVGVLYIAQLGTTMATLAIFSFFALHYGAPELLEKINIGPVMEDTAAALVGIVTFGHQLGYNNILSMYGGVLLLLPALLLIGSRAGLLHMVAASGALWLAAGLFRLGPPNFPNEGVWFLNPLSWQFLFVIGLAATMHVKRGGKLPVHPWMVGAAAAYLIAVLPQISGLARRPANNPLAVMGRHALPVFVTGTILSMVAQAWRLVHEPSIATDIAIVAAGVGAHFALAYYIEWYRGLVRGSKPVPAGPEVFVGPPLRPAHHPLPHRVKPEMA